MLQIAPARLAFPVRHRLRLRRSPGGLAWRAGIVDCGLKIIKCKSKIKFENGSAGASQVQPPDETAGSFNSSIRLPHSQIGILCCAGRPPYSPFRWDFPLNILDVCAGNRSAGEPQHSTSAIGKVWITFEIQARLRNGRDSCSFYKSISCQHL